MYSTKEVADALGVSGQTIRAYTTEFGDYLSDDATPPSGGRRRFTDEDLRVLEAAKSLLDRGLTYDATRERLAQGVHTIEVEPEEAEETEPASAQIVSVQQLETWYDTIHAIETAWQRIVERQELEIEGLREENRRLREELREETSKSWLDRLRGR